MTVTKDPADTFMMGVMHDALRRDFARAREVLTAATPPGDTQRIAVAEHLSFMLTFLDAHHHSEDDTLWPLVRANDPTLGQLLDSMSRDHEVIAGEVDQLEEAAQRSAGQRDDNAQEGLLAAIDRLTAVLGPHLDREEAELMPRVAECMSNDEWRAFEKSAKPPFSIPVLAEYFNWFLDDLDHTRRRKVLRALPAPIVFVSTRIFGPGYRRRAAIRWGGPQEGSAQS